AEIRRPHAGIAALLVDLVAGRLDEHGTVQRAAVPERRADDQRMGDADGGDACRPAGAARIREREKIEAGHDVLAGVAAMKASSSAKVDVPSIGPRTVTVRAPAALA